MHTLQDIKIILDTLEVSKWRKDVNDCIEFVVEMEATHISLNEAYTYVGYFGLLLRDIQ